MKPEKDQTPRSVPAADATTRAELWRLVDDLAHLSQHVPIVVEGKRDFETLRRLGIEGEVVTVNRGKGLYEVARELDRYDDVVLLMDWDARGEQLHRSLTRHLEANWERYTELRQRLRELLGDTIVEVEHLESALGERPKPNDRAAKD